MTEEKTKNRGWVKDAAIIFLAVLLVLTFFSSTIMNKSLPQVATSYVQPGTITAQIRGTAKVTAAETYEVKTPDARTIESVLIKAGQTVAVGEVLFTLSGSAGTDLTDAKSALADMQLAYQKALVSASQFDYGKDNAAIANLRAALDEAVAARDALLVTDDAFNAAKTAAVDAQAKADAAQTASDKAAAAVDAAQELLNSVTQGSGDATAVNAAYATWQQAVSELNDAKNALATAKLVYGAAYAELKTEAEAQIIKDYQADYDKLTTDSAKRSFLDGKLPVYLPAVAERYAGSAPSSSGTSSETSSESSSGGEGGEGSSSSSEAAGSGITGAEKYEAYTKITAAEKAVKAASAAEVSARNAYNDASSAFENANSGNTLYTRYKKQLAEAKTAAAAASAALTAAQKVLTDAKDALTALNTRKTDYKTAADAAKSAETALQDKIYDLAAAQKNDSKTAALERLDLQASKEKIAQQEDKVAKLEASASGSAISSKVDGIVKAVNVTAGNTTTPDQVVATIEIPGRGYSAEMTVTTAQAKKLTVGDSASVSSGWWGSQQDIQAVLKSIRNDPQNPQQSKILVFDVTGKDVESGSELSLTMGEKSRTYDTVVPSSAVRSDSNGSFVYIITVKNSPLSNRYIATRVDVQVLAKDDVNSAVSGGLTSGDYVITTSTAPVEKGKQVRLADSQ